MVRRLLLALIILTAVPAAAGDDRSRYLRENRLLEAELALARKSALYFVFNLKEKAVSINARGIRLKELPIRSLRCWGSPLADRAYRLERKSALFKPGRETIKPGENSGKDDFKIEAMELTDMPSRYTLVLDDGVKVRISPSTEGVVSGVGNLLNAAVGFFTRPISMSWYAFRGKHYTAVDRALDKDDARAVYWSFSEGAGAILYPP